MADSTGASQAQVDTNTGASYEPGATEEKQRAANPPAAPLNMPMQADVVPIVKPTKGRGLFSRGDKKANEGPSEKEKQLDRDSDSGSSSRPIKSEVPGVPPPDEVVPPVGFTDLFRYATKFELAINFIGLICAAASGAAQVSPMPEISEPRR